MWTYQQSTGKLSHNGVLIGTGFAGNGEGYNNPDMQNVSKIGPLPRGKYKIGRPYAHPHLGPIVMNLTPDKDNEMFGRDLFRIHGKSKVHPEKSSKGCICQEQQVRQQVADSYDEDLEVIE